MNEDYRIKVGFLDNPKTRKLRRRFGAEGIISLLRLYEFTAVHRPKGELTGMDEDDILDAADWDGGREFITALIDLTLLDQANDGTLSIHDWTVHNGYAAFAEERSAQARKAAGIRWQQKRGITQSNADRTSDSNAKRNTTSNARSTSDSNAPSPAPAPPPSPDGGEGTSGSAALEAHPAAAAKKRETNLCHIKNAKAALESK